MIISGENTVDVLSDLYSRYGEMLITALLRKCVKYNFSITKLGQMKLYVSASVHESVLVFCSTVGSLFRSIVPHTVCHFLLLTQVLSVRGVCLWGVSWTLGWAALQFSTHLYKSFIKKHWRSRGIDSFERHCCIWRSEGCRSMETHLNSCQHGLLHFFHRDFQDGPANFTLLSDKEGKVCYK